MKPKDFTQEQREEFIEAFYSHEQIQFNDLAESELPWGMPWFYYAENWELFGDTIKKMAHDFVKKMFGREIIHEGYWDYVVKDIIHTELQDEYKFEVYYDRNPDAEEKADDKVDDYEDAIALRKKLRDGELRIYTVDVKMTRTCECENVEYDFFLNREDGIVASSPSEAIKKYREELG